MQASKMACLVKRPRLGKLISGKRIGREVRRVWASAPFTSDNNDNDHFSQGTGRGVTREASSLQVGVLLPDTRRKRGGSTSTASYMKQAFTAAGYHLVGGPHRQRAGKRGDPTRMNDDHRRPSPGGAKIMIMDHRSTAPDRVRDREVAQSKGVP